MYFHADFRSVIGFSLSSLFTEILMFKKNNHNFQTSDDGKIPITYSKSGGKCLLKTIKKLCETKNV